MPARMTDVHLANVPLHVGASAGQWCSRAEGSAPLRDPESLQLRQRHDTVPPLPEHRKNPLERLDRSWAARADLGQHERRPRPDAREDVGGRNARRPNVRIEGRYGSQRAAIAESIDRLEHLVVVPRGSGPKPSYGCVAREQGPRLEG